MKINLTPYRSKYRDFIWQTYVDSMQCYIEIIWGWDLSWQVDDFEKSLDKYTTKVIVIGNNEIGYVQYKKEPEHLYINMIILQKVYQCKGLGPIIIEKISNIDSSLPLKLKCFRVNDRAYGFYLENGFKVTKTDKEFYTLFKTFN